MRSRRVRTKSRCPHNHGSALPRLNVSFNSANSLAPLVDSPRRGLGRSAFALIVLLFAFLTPSQIPSDFVNRGFTGELIRCAILVIIEIQSFRDPLQYPQRPGRFLFGKEVDLEFEVIASLQRLVNGALADQHAGSKENGLQGENRRQQGKRIFIEGLVSEIEIDD